MEERQAIRALAALAHDSRLRVFRLLAKAGAEGLAAGRIADEVALPATTLSFHLKELLKAELITDRREGRSIVYSVNTCAIKCFLAFFLKDCCGGKPELCGPAFAPATPKAKRARAVPPD